MHRQARFPIADRKSDGSPICSFAFTRDANGNILTSLREDDSCWYYDYDGLQRLTQAAWKDDQGASLYGYEYNYDKVGNRASLVANGVSTYYSYNEANELTDEVTLGGETVYYTYDGRGNQTHRSVLGGETLYFDYNSRNLITRIDSTEDGFTPNTFEYNALGQRIKKVDSTGSTRYVWDGLNITAEYDEEGTIQRRYTHGHTPIHGVFSLISVQDAQGCRYFYHFDQVGGVRALTTQAAATDTTYEYSPFGRILAETAGSAPNDFTFPATYVQLAGVPSFRVSSARLYDARIGRFTSEDALKEHPVPGFAKEAPLRLVDPSGLYVIHTERIRDLRGWLCGVVTVDLNEKGGLTLKFDDSKHQSCARCCPDNEFGWVQHWCWENDEGGLDCVYDNAAYRAPRPLLRMPGEGAPSNPNLPEQPNEENRPRTGHWPGNP